MPLRVRRRLSTFRSYPPTMRILALSLSLLAAHLVNGQRFIAQVRPAGSELWGYVTSTGDMIVPPTYK